MLSFIFLIALSSTGCDKITSTSDQLADSTIAQLPDSLGNKGDSTSTDENGNDGSSEKDGIVFGNGNGEKLVIDGSQQQFDCGVPIKIKGGNYASIIIRNIAGTAGCPVTITNQGTVVLSGTRHEMVLSNLNHVVITGDGGNASTKGFQFKDNGYRAVLIRGNNNYLTLQHMSFSNIGDYVISSDFNATYNAADPTTYSRGLKFLHLAANNVRTFLHFPGGIGNGKIIGLVKEVEIAYIQITNSPIIKNVVHFAAAEDYEIHHNNVSNVNMRNDDHNAMFLMMGNGKFYNNLISDHQGNAIRAWAFSIGQQPKDIYIYNNIVLNSRKYSAFEVQSIQSYMITGKTTFANAKIFNNTVGNMNTSRDWYGVVLDAYRLFGGKCEVFNNLAFNFRAPHPQSHIVSYMSINLADLKEENNFYYQSADEAGIADIQTLKIQGNSPVKNAGIPLPFSIADFYGQSRKQNTPSVGAVE